MSTKPPICVLCTDGTNCDRETVHACELAGGDPRRVHMNALRTGTDRLSNYSALILPGGFSYGDDVASGKILAVELLSYLRDQLDTFVCRNKPILGICNGFQVLVRMGILPFGHLGEMDATLSQNDSGRFECRWVDLFADAQSICLLTRGMHGRITLPVAHGEGKFVADDTALYELMTQRQIPLKYVLDSSSAQDYPQHTQDYPHNPNGSLRAIAGVCDRTGRILGMMPHPERFVDEKSYPNWRRMKLPPYGLQIFRNLVAEASAV